MELIHYSFDARRLSGFSVRVTDDGGSFTASIVSGEYAHVDMTGAVDHRGNSPARLAALVVLAEQLELTLNTFSSGAGTYTVTFDQAAPTFYTIAYSGATLTLDFTEATAGERGPRLAAALGMSSAAALSGATSYSSTVRPMYLLIPAAMNRTGIKADRYDSNISTDARSDGGVYGQVSVARAATLKEWVQAAEDETVMPAVAFDEPGTAVHAHAATDAAPWSYQHAWDHALSYKCAMLVVDDVAASYAEAHEMRADGLTFDPRYTGADDYPMYSVEFRTRLLGRIP